MHVFEKELGNYKKSKGCYQVPLDEKASNGKISWDRDVKWRSGRICLEWMDNEKFPVDCKVRGNVIVRCRKNKNYPEKKCPTIPMKPLTLQSLGPSRTTSSQATATPFIIAPTVQSGHTLLRRIVLNTTSCKGCERGRLTLQVWGADDARTVHNCTTLPLQVATGLQAFEKELGVYIKNNGCHQAPLDAKVSDGIVSWDQRVKWKSNSICFEWMDDHKYPLDCKVHGNRIGSCKTNREYPGLKCPSI